MKLLHSKNHDFGTTRSGSRLIWRMVMLWWLYQTEPTPRWWTKTGRAPTSCAGERFCSVFTLFYSVFTPFSLDFTQSSLCFDSILLQCTLFSLNLHSVLTQSYCNVLCFHSIFTLFWLNFTAMYSVFTQSSLCFHSIFTLFSLNLPLNCQRSNGPRDAHVRKRCSRLQWVSTSSFIFTIPRFEYKAPRFECKIHHFYPPEMRTRATLITPWFLGRSLL